MQKFIPKAKLSKKAKRQLDLEQRKTWVINPVSRKIKDKKKYDRKRVRIEQFPPDSFDLWGSCVSNVFF